MWYSKTPQPRTYFSKKQTDLVLVNEVYMAFSGCGSYRKDSYDYHEYIAVQYVLNKLEGRMIALDIRGSGILLFTKQFISYTLIIQFAYP